MKVTLLGHASLLVETERVRVLMDPVFQDPFEDNTVSCPKRVVHRDRLPPVDAVVISHGHLDHFDLPSLETLPKSTPVYAPPSPFVLEGLQRVGFENLEVLGAFDPISIQNLTVLPTPSSHPQEFGAVFRDDQSALWNHVDSVVQQATCVDVLEYLDGKLDAAIVTYNPLLEYAEMWVTETDFPQARYERLLEIALCTHARIVIPGSSGQRFDETKSWLNPRVYPVSRERFVQDLERLAPERSTLIFNPGDCLNLPNGSVSQRDFVETLKMDTHLVKFEPERSPAAPMIDPNTFGFSGEELQEAVEKLLNEMLPFAFREKLTPTLRGVLRRLWDRRAVLQISIVSPAKTVHAHLTEWHPEPTWVRGEHENPDYIWEYRASELLALHRGRADDFELRARRRREASGSFRLSALDPGRLHGVDLYETVDEEYPWNPLQVLE